jgi:hypothetical protein
VCACVLCGCECTRMCLCTGVLCVCVCVCVVWVWVHADVPMYRCSMCACWVMLNLCMSLYSTLHVQLMADTRCVRECVCACMQVCASVHVRMYLCVHNSYGSARNLVLRLTMCINTLIMHCFHYTLYVGNKPHFNTHKYVVPVGYFST